MISSVCHVTSEDTMNEPLIEKDVVKLPDMDVDEVIEDCQETHDLCWEFVD